MSEPIPADPLPKEILSISAWIEPAFVDYFPGMNRLTHELLDVASDVVRRFVDFESYGSPSKAQKALQRRCPGFPLEDYANAFQKAIALQNDAAETVKNDQELLLNTWLGLQKGDQELEVVETIISDLNVRHPEFSPQTCSSTLSWIVYWHYAR